jgi:hypothetical protein
LSTSDGSGLLLQGFAQLVEQARVLDGDDCLVGEILYQLDLLVGKGANLLAIDGDRADKLVLLEHRHADERARARKLSDRGTSEGLFRSDVGNVDHPLCFKEPAQGRCTDLNFRIASQSQVFERTRSAMHRNHPEFAPFNERQIGELSLADVGCICQNRGEDRLQLTGETRNRSQDLGGRSLLLQSFSKMLLRLGEFAGSLVELLL